MNSALKNKAYEVNFDGIVGPTHHYAGLSYGNIASIANESAVSNPREAALQGLEKMRYLANLGILQAVLPPHERPYLPMLRSLGFTGNPGDILKKVYKSYPKLLHACSSGAAMWTANAATISPSADCLDSRVHITPANLSHKFHRSMEAATTGKVLQAIFTDPTHFHIHPPLPPSSYFSDEGAANHVRFCNSYGDQGVELFVYGRRAFDENSSLPKKFPARQTLEASEAIAKLHQINDEKVVFAQQNPAAIDAGVFHNDVISVANQNLFFYHEKAFLNMPKVIESIQRKIDIPLTLIEVNTAQVSLKDAVASYLFNSQIVTTDKGMVLLAPKECQEVTSVKSFLDSVKWPIKKICYSNLRESMRNGGGPACLRLRIVLTPAELAAANPHVFFSEMLYETLKKWINRHYRDRLPGEDIADPQLYQESLEALDELTKILHLGPIYPFQKQ